MDGGRPEIIKETRGSYHRLMYRLVYQNFCFVLKPDVRN